MVNIFAEIGDDNIVLRTIVAGHVDAEQGEQWCNSLYGGTWKQCCTEERHYAEPTFTFDSENNVFISPKPFDSWILDENFYWKSPVPYPQDDKIWIWNESTLSWEFARDK